MALGSFTIDGLLSSQSVGGLDAGFYIYADDCLNIVAEMEKALSWAETCLSDVIDKASGQTGILSTASTKLSSAFSSSSAKGQVRHRTLWPCMFGSVSDVNPCALHN